MAKCTLIGAGLLLLGNASMASAAMAQTTTTPMAEASRTRSAVAESRAFSDDRGTLRSFSVEEGFVKGDTTFLVAPTFGERRMSSERDDALGLRGTLYENWSPTVSTSTSLFLAEDTPVFAHIDVAQDLTVRVADRTTLTAGIRWADYFGGRDATFLSLGARRYFSGGSIAYRLTGAQVENQDTFLAHLVNLRLNDRGGDGNTQLWLSAGDASLSQFDDSLSGSNYAFTLQRTQPLSRDVALVAAAGLSSYDSPDGRYTATNVRLGLSAKLD